MSRRERGDDEEEDMEVLSDLSLGTPRSDFGVGDEEDDDYDPDLSDLNNPDVDTLPDAPRIGGQPRSSDIFGESAENFGRSSSPKLYAQASHFPAAVQFRVWRWENGIPVAVGAIDAEATEDDFIKQFVDAMPRPGDDRFQYRLRPVDQRGAELGKEFTINISEHHTTLRHIRRRRKMQEEEDRSYGGGRHGDVIVQGGSGDGSGAHYAEEMGRMFEQAVESAERRTDVLQETLEAERDRLRAQEALRAEERVSMAERSTGVVQKMTERLMDSDRQRSEEMLKSQQSNSQLLLTTISSSFSQQQEAARAQADRLREADERRMSQDREFFDRQRAEAEERRIREREEADVRRRLDAEEHERKRVEERDRLTAEVQRMEGQRKYELEQMRIEAQRREQELERKRQVEKEESDRRRELDKTDADRRLNEQKLELQHRQEQLRLEAETRRTESEERRVREEAEWQRRREVEREESARKERMDHERFEREKQEFERKREEDRRADDKRREEERARLEEQRRQDDRKAEQERLRIEEMRRLDDKRRDEERRADDKRREDERRDWDRRETLRREENERVDRERREEMQRQADQRAAELQLQMKQMETSAQRDREHAERMLKTSQLDRDAQRDAQERREKAEQAAREQAERDRQRQHDMEMKRLEAQAQADREHAERMMQLSKSQNGGGSLIEQLGMDTPELLTRIFGGSEGSEEAGGWVDAIPKVLGSLADLGKAAITAKQQEGRPGAGRRPMVAVQTPSGIAMVPTSALSGLQRPPPETGPLPPQNFQPSPAAPAPVAVPAPPAPAVPATGPKAEMATAKNEVLAPDAEINTLRRAKEEGIKLADQKKARRGIRTLISKIAKAKEEEWVGILTAALTKNVGIYYYIKAVTVNAALAEARTDETLALRIVAAMKESGMIPPDVPFDEEDYARLKADPAETPTTETPAAETSPTETEIPLPAQDPATPIPPTWPATAGTAVEKSDEEVSS